MEGNVEGGSGGGEGGEGRVRWKNQVSRTVLYHAKIAGQ